MHGKSWMMLRLGPVLALAVILTLGGCATAKKWVGWDKGEDEEELVAPEAKEETVIIDGKTYVRSKNPYWLVQPGAPEYFYVEKGREFISAQQQHGEFDRTQFFDCTIQMRCDLRGQFFMLSDHAA